VRKIISRKRFISSAVAGLAGISLIPPVRSEITENTVKRPVGKTGIMVTPVCFGASRTNDESLIKFAIDKGFNLIDTGRSYTNGNNERLVGKAVSGIRKNVVIQSKHRINQNKHQ